MITIPLNVPSILHGCHVEFARNVAERMGTIIPVEDIGKLEEIIMDYDQIAAGMGHGMSGNNEKFCSELEDIIHYIL